jgi:hypothetical protein
LNSGGGKLKRETVFSALMCALLTACGGAGGSSGGGGGGGVGGGGAISPGGSTTTDTSHGTAACATGSAVFSVSPIALGSVTGWVPLGNMEPPGHTFPTDHQYLYFANPSSSTAATVPVVAPSDMRIWMIYQTTGSEPQYSIWMQPCAQVIGRLGSITSLSSDLAVAAGPINQNCQTSAAGTQCQTELQYDVKAGQVIGSISTTTAYALDFWLWDSRATPIQFADPARFTAGPEPGFSEANIVPASAYYTAAVTPQIDAKLGAFDGSFTRTVAPIGGTIQVDVNGTARGYWFNPTEPYPPETFHAALAQDNIQPNTTEVVSLGISQINAGALRLAFTPVLSGQINRAFETVTADNNVYCYEGIAENTNGAIRLVWLQMLNATTLKIEELGPTFVSCAGSVPWIFSANAVTYVR